MNRALALKREHLTVEEYLAIDEKSKYRCEFIGGEFYQMAGGRYNHSLISTNIIRLLGNSLEANANRCDVHGGDLRLIIGKADYVYPDVVVTCNPKLVPNIFDTLENPQVIFEVLSKSTEFKDKEIKLKLYLLIESLTDYLLVSQKEMRIEHYQRKSMKEWTYRVYTEADEIINLASIESKLTTAQVYRNVEFPINLKLVKPRKRVF